MSVTPSTARELAQIVREIGADVLSGNLRFLSEIGSCLLSDLD